MFMIFVIDMDKEKELVRFFFNEHMVTHTFTHFLNFSFELIFKSKLLDLNLQ